MILPAPIQNFIEIFSKLPSLGPRLATRLAFYLVGLDHNTFTNLQKALTALATLDRCPSCFSLKEKSLSHCAICTNQNRNPHVIAIVEKDTDMMALEATGKFTGRYFILGELAERGVLGSAEKLRLAYLKKKIMDEYSGTLQELILALNLTTFGDFTAQLIAQEFKTLAKKITRLGRGIPTGGEIEFADQETLIDALERRT